MNDLKRRAVDASQDEEAPFLSHLIELRARMMRSLLAVVVLILALMPFANDLYTIIAAPLMAHLPEGSSMIATEVATPFIAPFKLAVVVAVFIAMPFVLYQIWAFVAPGLYRHEQGFALPMMVASGLLFYLGAVFAYFAVFPLVFGFFAAAAPEGVTVMTDIARYLDFVLTMFFAFGLAFQIPVATVLLVRSGIVEREQLIAARPYVIVGVFVVAALLTPPEPLSQCLLAIPMWALFEVGLALSRVTGKRAPDEETPAADAGPPTVT